MYQSTLKVAGGKLIRVNFEMENVDDDHVIRGIRITGDFFLHPEDVLPDVEKALEGLGWPEDEEVYMEAVQKVLDERRATFVGVSPQDIAHVILTATEHE